MIRAAPTQPAEVTTNEIEIFLLCIECYNFRAVILQKINNFAVNNLVLTPEHDIFHQF